jgi:hypothetical protein
VIVWQYSGIDGLKSFEKEAMARYDQRSGRSAEPEPNTAFLSPESLRFISQHYERQLGFVMSLTYFALVMLAGLFIFKVNKRGFIKESIPIWIPVSTLFAGILMHLLIFYNFNCLHDFGTLKTSILFALIIGLAFAAMQKQMRYYHKSVRYIAYAAPLSIYVYMISESINKYYSNNNSSQLSSLHINVGTMARIYAQPDELVFAPDWTPMGTFSAQRLVPPATSTAEVISILKELKYPKAIFIDAEDTEEGKIRQVVRVSANGETQVLVSNYVPPRIDQ